MEPYIPKEAIVFLHGKWGTFKTPLTLNIAKALAEGQSELFGCKLSPAKVLYVQADTPKRVIVPRMKRLGAGLGKLDINFCYPGFNILKPHEDENDSYYYDILAKVHRENAYDMVFIDSLRAIHSEDDKEATTVHKVYRALAKLFTGATVLIIHHDKKASPDGLPGNESFSGSQAWVNHATVGLKVSVKDAKLCHVELQHTKSQASEMVEPLLIQMKEGIFAKCLTDAALDEVEDFITQMEVCDKKTGELFTLAQIDEQVAEYFSVSIRTARRRRADLEESRPSFKNMLGQRLAL